MNNQVSLTFTNRKSTLQALKALMFYFPKTLTDTLEKLDVARFQIIFNDLEMSQMFQQRLQESEKLKSKLKVID